MPGLRRKAVGASLSSQEEDVVTHIHASVRFPFSKQSGPGWGVLSVSLVDPRGLSMVVVPKEMVEDLTCLSMLSMLSVVLGKHGAILGGPFRTLSHSVLRATHVTRGDIP